MAREIEVKKTADTPFRAPLSLSRNAPTVQTRPGSCSLKHIKFNFPSYSAESRKKLNLAQAQSWHRLNVAHFPAFQWHVLWSFFFRSNIAVVLIYSFFVLIFTSSRFRVVGIDPA